MFVTEFAYIPLIHATTINHPILSDYANSRA